MANPCGRALLVDTALLRNADSRNRPQTNREELGKRNAIRNRQMAAIAARIAIRLRQIIMFELKRILEWIAIVDVHQIDGQAQDGQRQFARVELPHARRFAACERYFSEERG